MGIPKLFYIWGKNVEKILATSCIKFQTGRGATVTNIVTLCKNVLKFFSVTDPTSKNVVYRWGALHT